MEKTLHVIINTEVEEFNYNISVLGVYSTLEGAIDTMHAYIKERFAFEDVDSRYTEWDLAGDNFTFHSKIHTVSNIEYNDEVTLILHTTINNDNKCINNIDYINESFDDAENNLLQILHKEFADKVEYNANSLIEHDGNELTYKDWIDANFSHSLKWIAVDKFDTVHQYLIETKNIDNQTEDEWCEMDEDDISGLLELFVLYQDMGYEWIIQNPSQIHPTLNYWLSLISKEEFIAYFDDYQQKSSTFFNREEEDETFDAIEASNEVLHEILQSILAHK